LANVEPLEQLMCPVSSTTWDDIAVKGV
jgi:hypothetical protein